MSWAILLGLVLGLGVALFAALSRRIELARMEQGVVERRRAVRQGSAGAQLSQPVIDLSRCLGCGTCVAVCPETDVLALVHGQAVVVNGAHCAGVSACERECPVGAITVTIANLAERTDVPVVSHELEAVGSPDLFLAGEVTAHALIKTAIEHGTSVAAEVARRAQESARTNPGQLDLVVVGAGPAGLACSLEAKRRGLSFVTLEQETRPGGTVAKYPRRKLVLTQPVELPLYGRLERASYTKEELVDLWTRIAVEQELPIRGQEVFEGLDPDPSGGYLVRTSSGVYAARHVCLAVGRRGVPKTLGVPGEELAKVAYSLLDAQSYQGRRVLVVGGGDSAIEAALGLAEQPGNQVFLSYRQEAFFRIRSRNAERLEQALLEQKLAVLFRSRVLAIGPDAVDLAIEGDAGVATYRLENDDVFVMVGGVAPFELLERSGVSFDPSLRPARAPIVEQGTGLTQALVAAFALAVAALLWATWHADYYLLPAEARPAHAKHVYLRPGLGLGLQFGITAVVLIGVNLLYLVRRTPRFGFRLGTLRAWMTSHVATGILAFLCATLHAAMAPRNTVGGHALLALAFLLLTGAIGRYFYAYVPRAANGRELALDEVRAELFEVSKRWDANGSRFGERVRTDVLGLVHAGQWKGSFLGRVLALLGVQRKLSRVLHELVLDGRRAGIDAREVEETVRLARKAQRTALMAAHYEDVRAVLDTWRYLHRWVAALMIALIALHVLYALAYGAYFPGGRA